MDPVKDFEAETKRRVASYAQNAALQEAAQDFMRESLIARYSYNFTWMGRPIIQHPQDLVALQEIVWSVKPDLIVELGIAHGGSLIFYASLLELLGGERYVLGVDIDIRQHNREAIDAHQLRRRIEMIEGSSLSEQVISQVRSHAADKQRVLVSFDSNHTHQHVLDELRAYAPLVTMGSYAIVFDGIIESMPEELYQDRPWGPGNNPLTAVQAFLAEQDQFVVDQDIEHKLVATAAPSGYLRRVR